MLPWKSLSASLQLGVLTEGWNLAEPLADGAEDARVFRFTVYFAAPFGSPPIVHLGLTGFDLDQRDSNRLILRATQITNESFVAEISSWRETRVYSVEFSWLALGA
ncbi:MAG: H-type lectin domain-containing protein [Chthoniobacter sp.]|uniref:H-type lectin domain-containing protein n=1 Tax=Chthoniobacter sp. TaxID=2510640 RepID=UPI0032A46755